MAVMKRPRLFVESPQQKAIKEEVPDAIIDLLERHMFSNKHVTDKEPLPVKLDRAALRDLANFVVAGIARLGAALGHRARGAGVSAFGNGPSNA